MGGVVGVNGTKRHDPRGGQSYSGAMPLQSSAVPTGLESSLLSPPSAEALGYIGAAPTGLEDCSLMGLEDVSFTGQEDAAFVIPRAERGGQKEGSAFSRFFF